MDFGELVQRLYDKYAPVDPTVAGLADAVQNEPWIALAGLLKVGRERGDLTAAEARFGLQEAEARTFGKLSDQIAHDLREYLKTHAVA